MTCYDSKCPKCAEILIEIHLIHCARCSKSWCCAAFRPPRSPQLMIPYSPPKQHFSETPNLSGTRISNIWSFSLKFYHTLISGMLDVLENHQEEVQQLAGKLGFDDSNGVRFRQMLRLIRCLKDLERKQMLEIIQKYSQERRNAIQAETSLSQLVSLSLCFWKRFPPIEKHAEMEKTSSNMVQPFADSAHGHRTWEVKRIPKKVSKQISKKTNASKCPCFSGDRFALGLGWLGILSRRGCDPRAFDGHRQPRIWGLSDTGRAGEISAELPASVTWQQRDLL